MVSLDARTLRHDIHEPRGRKHSHGINDRQPASSGSLPSSGGPEVAKITELQQHDYELFQADGVAWALKHFVRR